MTARTLAGAEFALNKNFVSLGGDLGFTHAFEYLHIIDRGHHLMAWTRQPWETVPAQLIRDGPNARVYQRCERPGTDPSPWAKCRPTPID